MIHRLSELRAIAFTKTIDLAVRRVVGLRVERLSARDARGLSAVDRNGIDVAEQLEDDRATVGGDVELEPRALVGREFQRLGATA